MIRHTFWRARFLGKTMSVLLLLFSFSFFFAHSLSAASQKAVILPLKIQSTASSIELAAKADTALFEAQNEENLVSVSRNAAEKLINYDGTWPPNNSSLQKVTKSTGYNYVATGTLTAIGELISIDIKTVDTLMPSQPVFFYRHAIPKEQLNNALIDLVAEIATYADREHRIVAITPQGNRRVDSGAILRKINTKAGDVYDPSTLREDIKTIYAMGYFNDVQVNVDDSDKGKVVTFKVIEKPIISSVIYDGVSELELEDVKAVANIKEFHILNPVQISTAKEAIIGLYESKGFYNAKVESKIAYPAESGAIVTFDINEGSKVYIEEITFEGNNSYDSDDLLDNLETKEKGWLTWLTADGLLDMEKIRMDADRLVAFYNTNGFLDAKVAEPKVTQEEDEVFLHFVIQEGERFRVGTVDFTGDLIIDKAKLASLVTVRKEPYLNRQMLRDNMLAITDAYSELGFAFADVRPRTSRSAKGNRLDILFDIRKNDLVYVDRITIRGNSRTRDNVIRRELSMVEGGLFSSTALRKSNQALQRLSYFSEVSITPEPTSDPSRMNVVIEVKEKPTGTFSIGVGYSTSDDIILSGSISENNWLGRGDTLSLTGDIGGSSSDFNLAYTNPRLNDSYLSWGADLFSDSREYDDYDKESTGAGIRIGYPIWKKWKLFANYSLTDTQLTKLEDDASFIIRKSEDINITSALKFTLVEDTRNRRFLATEGHRTSISLKYAGGPLMGDAEFLKTEATTGWYVPLFWGTTFHFKGSAGYVLETQDNSLPVYERFFLGGMRSMRGFEFAEMSPKIVSAKDGSTVDNGEKIGGNAMWYTNFEYIFPISDSQGVAGMVFFDVGQITADDIDEYELEGEDVRYDAGLGLMWNSPMGPLVITWGYNLDAQEGEESSVVDFSMGGTF